MCCACHFRPCLCTLYFQVMPSGAAALRLLGFSPSVTSLDLTSSSIRASGASVVSSRRLALNLQCVWLMFVNIFVWTYPKNRNGYHVLFISLVFFFFSKRTKSGQNYFCICLLPIVTLVSLVCKKNSRWRKITSVVTTAVLWPTWIWAGTTLVQAGASTCAMLCSDLALI